MMEVLKYLVVFASVPIWLPFAKALFGELTDALRADGGLSGPSTNARQRAEIQARINRTEEPRLVDEPIANARASLNTQQQGSSSSGPAPTRAAPSFGERPAGVRSFRP